MWNVNLAVPTCIPHQQTTTEEVFTNEETTQCVCVHVCVRVSAVVTEFLA